MAVLNAQYKQPSSAYSQGLKDLIDALLKVNPQDRPDIHQVRSPYHLGYVSLSFLDYRLSR